MIRLVLLGGIAAGVAGAFVIVKNRQHGMANAKGGMECEIVQLHKQIETLDLDIEEMIGREVLKRLVAAGKCGSGLVVIREPETVRSGRQEGEQFVSNLRSQSAGGEY